MKVHKDFTITEKVPIRVYVVCALNQKKAQVGAFSVIMKLRVIFGNLRFQQ